MGTIAFFLHFLIASLPSDAADNRKHVHVFYLNKRNSYSVAKIWIEKNGTPGVEVAYSSLSGKMTNKITTFVEQHLPELTRQVEKSLAGEKTEILKF